MLDRIIKIIFSYQTDNIDGKINQDILLCQKELCNFLNQRGIHCELDFYLLNKKRKDCGMHANLVAFNPEAKGPFILLQGHIDTVLSFPGHKVIIDKKEIKGRGAVDMKGSLAGYVNAFSEMYHEKNCKYSPVLLITADEEANSFAGILNFIKKYKSIIRLTKLAVNGEPTNFSVYTRFRGIFGAIIEKKGKEGHSAYPGKGTIIEDMLPLINAINKFIVKAKKVKNKKFGSTEGAFTVINSGKKINQLLGNFLAGFSLRTVKPISEYNVLFKKIVTKNISRGTRMRNILVDPIYILK